MTPEELKALLTDFKTSKGWQTIQEWLKPYIDNAELKLLSDETLTEEQQKDLKKSWKLHKKFYEFPDFIIAKSEAGVSPEKPNLDPYDG